MRTSKDPEIQEILNSDFSSLSEESLDKNESEIIKFIKMGLNHRDIEKLTGREMADINHILKKSRGAIVC